MQAKVWGGISHPPTSYVRKATKRICQHSVFELQQRSWHSCITWKVVNAHLRDLCKYSFCCAIPEIASNEKGMFAPYYPWPQKQQRCRKRFEQSSSWLGRCLPWIHWSLGSRLVAGHHCIEVLPNDGLSSVVLWLHIPNNNGYYSTVACVIHVAGCGSRVLNTLHMIKHELRILGISSRLHSFF